MIFNNERSRYGHDVVVRRCDGSASPRWNHRVQEECLALLSVGSLVGRHDSSNERFLHDAKPIGRRELFSDGVRSLNREILSG